MNLPVASSHLEAFPHSWSAKVLPSPPLIAPARSLLIPQRIPGEEDALQRGALLVEVRPDGAPPFLATCARGFRDQSLPSGVWSCPHPHGLLAVAGGYAYLMPTLEPERTTLLEQRPVVHVLAAPEQHLLLLTGFHDVLALGAEGVRWRSARLTWEGLTLNRIEHGVLHGIGWDMFTDADVPFELDLVNGRHTGGGYRIP